MKLWIYDLMSIQLLLIFMVKYPYGYKGCCDYNCDSLENV